MEQIGVLRTTTGDCRAADEATVASEKFAACYICVSCLAVFLSVGLSVCLLACIISNTPAFVVVNSTESSILIRSRTKRRRSILREDSDEDHAYCNEEAAIGGSDDNREHVFDANLVSASGEEISGVGCFVNGAVQVVSVLGSRARYLH